MPSLSVDCRVATLVHGLKAGKRNVGSRMKIHISDDKGERIGALIPIDQGLASDPIVIQKLTKWRARFGRYFLTQFVPTEERTRNWLENVVLPSDNRVLFLICTLDDEAIGNLGFCGLTRDQVELDHLIRGEKGGHPRLIYFAALALLGWLFDDLCISRASLHVFSNNGRAISFYKSVGFLLTAAHALVKNECADGVRYVICEMPDAEVEGFSYWEMTLAAAEFKAIHRRVMASILFDEER